MKNLAPIAFSLLLLTGCKSLRPLQTSGKQDAAPSAARSSSEEHMQPGPDNNEPVITDHYNAPMSINTGFTVDKASLVQFKYSIILDTEVEYLANRDLYSFIDKWWGTPYRIGGMTQRGIDCSAFIQNLQAAIYNITLPRTAKEQKSACIPVKKEDLREGDLVFFNTRGGISHVGLYLHNHKFVHASNSGGVMISDLQEPYWQKRFMGSGRPNPELVHHPSTGSGL